MTQRKPSPTLLIVLLLAHVGVTALTWRDLSHRPTAEVRGSRSGWRLASALNTSGSVAYFLFGRRR